MTGEEGGLLWRHSIRGQDIFSAGALDRSGKGIRKSRTAGRGIQIHPGM